MARHYLEAEKMSEVRGQDWVTFVHWHSKEREELIKFLKIVSIFF
jgi:hypothetical protein